MAFEPINTQEEFDAAISARLKRERESTEKKYEGFLSPEEASKQYEGYLSPEEEAKKYKGYLTPDEAAAKDAKIKRYETDSAKTRIAYEKGLPFAMASRLTGETEEEIAKDADVLAKLMGDNHEPPQYDPEGVLGKEATKKAAMKDLLKGLTAE